MSSTRGWTVWTASRMAPRSTAVCRASARSGAMPAPWRARRDAARHMASSLPETGGQRAGSHNRTEPGQHERNRREKITGGLADAGGGPRVLDFGARRPADVLGVARLLIMIAADDRELFPGHAGSMQTRGQPTAACGHIGKDGNDEWVRHRGAILT